MGWLPPSSLPAAAAQGGRSSRRGGSSKPVQGPAGWYVLKVLGRRAGAAYAVRGGPHEIAADELTAPKRSAALRALARHGAREGDHRAF